MQSREVVMDGQREEQRHMTLSLLCVFWCFYLLTLLLSAALVHNWLETPTHTHTHTTHACGDTQTGTHKHIRSCVLQGAWVWLWAIGDDSRAICWFISGDFLALQLEDNQWNHCTLSILCWKHSVFLQMFWGNNKSFIALQKLETIMKQSRS